MRQETGLSLNGLRGRLAKKIKRKIMDEVEEFIIGQESPVREIMQVLHDYLSDQPGIRSKITYRIPFYYNRSWICYLSPLKKGGIEFAFTRGNELSNVQGILEARGRKQVAGIRLHSVDEIPMDSLSEVIQEAILLDETVPYTSPYFPNRKKS